MQSSTKQRECMRFAGETALADLPDELFGQDKSPVPALAPQWTLDGKGAPFPVSVLGFLSRDSKLRPAMLGSNDTHRLPVS